MLKPLAPTAFPHLWGTPSQSSGVGKRWRYKRAVFSAAFDELYRSFHFLKDGAGMKLGIGGRLNRQLLTKSPWLETRTPEPSRRANPLEDISAHEVRRVMPKDPSPLKQQEPAACPYPWRPQSQR